QSGPNHSVPILGFSADTQVEMDDLSDFDGLVSKPIILSALIEAIAASLCERSVPNSFADVGAA
ncbi:MAG: hypothetical protein K0M78_11280, partial [Brevundimonas sp.]|nr:hypothetical protein [Brevundimonas sp.]